MFDSLDPWTAARLAADGAVAALLLLVLMRQRRSTSITAARLDTLARRLKAAERPMAAPAPAVNDA